MQILVTGVAGFIGNQLALELLERGHAVVGVDNLNDYYSVQLKRDRLARLAHATFRFELLDLADRSAVESLFAGNTFESVVHLAAQAGVRYSLTNPHAYVDSNLTAFVNVLEGCRAARLRNFLYASSSSVYGANRKTPFAVGDPVDQPISLYAATKRANELIAYSYSHLYGLPTTGLRFFTVYGPWGRPDMAVYRFADAILRGRPIDVYNSGNVSRDFTYIDDVVQAVVRLVERPPGPATDGVQADSAGVDQPPARLFNIGNNSPIDVNRLIDVLEKSLGKKAVRNERPMQPGDMATTYADIGPLQEAVGYRPTTPIETGIDRFVAWRRAYHGDSSG